MKTKSSKISKEEEYDHEAEIKKWKKKQEKKRANQGDMIGVLSDGWLDSLVLDERSCIACSHSPVRGYLGGILSDPKFGCPKCGHIDDTCF